jgi:hypothetical protein
MGIAIRLGKAAKKRKKRYNQAQDAFIFHTGNNDPADFVNPPKMGLGVAQEFLDSGGKKITNIAKKMKTRKKRKKGRGSLPV